MKTTVMPDTGYESRLFPYSRGKILLVLSFLTGLFYYPALSQETAPLIPQSTGKVIPRIPCRSNPAFSFAVYLPSVYPKEDSLPVFLAFDPLGNGLRPVEKYHDLAERYHFILIGSNDSQNGQTMDHLEEVSSVLLKEIRIRYSIHPMLIFCTGFSGGSRVAAINTYWRGGIRGMVGCGAGFPAVTGEPRFQAGYFGIVGNHDFNYIEMVNLEKRLAQQGIPHELCIFNGPHQWPPDTVMEEGIAWLWTRAMKEGFMKPDKALMASAAAASEKNRGRLTAILGADLEKELKQQAFYADAYFTRPISWWNKQIILLKDTSVHNPVYDLNMRLLSYMGILSYSLSEQAVEGKNREKLTRIIAIYEMVEPENKYIRLLKDQLNAMP